jgi:hypothetical protein
MDVAIIGDSAGVQKMLKRLDTALNPVAVAGFLGAVVDPYLRKRAKDRFANEGDDAVGGGWLPLAEATQQIRSSQGYGATGPINKRTGELEAYIVGAPSDLQVHAAGATLQMKPNKPTGELAKKVKTAQMGKKAEAGQRATPPRPVAAIGPQDLTFILTALAGSIKGSRFGR